MKFWCLPVSSPLSMAPPPLPSLPPRTDRDVTWRSPPPPPRLSRQEKLDRGVIVLKPRKNRRRKEVKEAKDVKVKEVKTVRYADDLGDYGPLAERLSGENVSRATPSPRPEPPHTPPPPNRGAEIQHFRQQSNTSGTSSGLGSVTTPSSSPPSQHYSSSSSSSSSSSGRGTSPTPTPSPPPIARRRIKSSSSSNKSSGTVRVTKCVVSRSTLSVSVGGIVRRREGERRAREGERRGREGELVLFPGVSRGRDRRERRGRRGHRRGEMSTKPPVLLVQNITTERGSET